MAEMVMVHVNGRALHVARGTTVAAALLQAGVPARISRSGEPRAPLCGMGVCFECRAIIDSVPHRRACLVLCEPGMEVATQCGV